MYETKVKDTGILDDRISSLDCKKGPHFFPRPLSINSIVDM